MVLRVNLLVLFCVALSAFALAKPEQQMVSLGRVAQATAITKVYSRPSAHSHLYYSVQPKEYLVVRDFKKDSPWKQVLLKDMHYGFARVESMTVLAYDYKVPVSSVQQYAEIPQPRATALSSRSYGSLRAAVADYAVEFKGRTPYVWGGTNLAAGADCSGFVKQLYGAIGVSLPRTAAEQVNVGVPVRRLEDLQKGDRLYFWDFNRNCVGHTGIYLGNGRFVHSSRTHQGVDTDYLGEAKWMRILVAARR